MGSHLFVHAVVAALVEEVEVLVGEKLRGSEGKVRAHGVSGALLVYRNRQRLAVVCGNPSGSRFVGGRFRESAFVSISLPNRIEFVNNGRNASVGAGGFCG